MVISGKVCAQQQEYYPDEEVSQGYKCVHVVKSVISRHQLTIPPVGMYRMWYVKTGVLKKKQKTQHPQTFKHIFTLREAKISSSVNNPGQEVR